MATTERAADGGGEAWGDGKITTAQAQEFARAVTPVRGDQETIARNLVVFPPALKVRGIFFEGLARIVGEAKGPEAMAGLLRRAGMGDKTTAFRSYPHRDFYKLYYLAARLLYPTAPMSGALRQVARTFFPIFKSSLLGRTMSALMGDRPTTILPLLARAYNISVEGNEHQAEVVDGKSVVWRGQAEAIEWYDETFAGIIEGAMPADLTAKVKLEERAPAAAGMARYRFRIDW